MMNERYIPQLQVRSSIRSGASGGGYVDGVWYPDRSGVCGGTTPPDPTPPYPPIPPYPPTNGGYVNGTWYSDRSGICG